MLDFHTLTQLHFPKCFSFQITFFRLFFFIQITFFWMIFTWKYCYNFFFFNFFSCHVLLTWFILCKKMCYLNATWSSSWLKSASGTPPSSVHENCTSGCSGWSLDEHFSSNSFTSLCKEGFDAKTNFWVTYFWYFWFLIFPEKFLLYIVLLLFFFTLIEIFIKLKKTAQ